MDRVIYWIGGSILGPDSSLITTLDTHRSRDETWWNCWQSSLSITFFEKSPEEIFEQKQSNMGVSIVMGVPIKMDGFCERENPNLKWMTGGYPYFRISPYDFQQLKQSQTWIVLPRCMIPPGGTPCLPEPGTLKTPQLTPKTVSWSSEVPS